MHSSIEELFERLVRAIDAGMTVTSIVASRCIA